METFNITNSDELSEALARLKSKRHEQKHALKKQFDATVDSLRPINLLKDGIDDVMSAPDVKGNAANNAIGLASGYLSKKLLFGSTRNPIKIILGTLLQIGVSNIVAKHADPIREGGANLISKLFHKNGKEVPSDELKH